MRKSFIKYIPLCLVACLFSCSHTSDVWEGTKTASRYLHRKSKALFSKDVDSKLVQNSDEFFGPESEEFIPLKDQDLQMQYVDYTAPQPKEDPGAPGSKVPGIKQFKAPTSDLANIFRNVYFNTDQHILRVKEYYHTINRVASYLKRNPKIYIFVEGHCDDRASESYNLSLGARRSNFVRNLLIKQGVNPEQIYTISYGKERPLINSNTRMARTKNRRVQFKIFDRNHMIRK